MLPLGCPWAASDLIGQGQERGQGQQIATGQGRDRDKREDRDRAEIGTGQEGVKKKRDKS